MTKPTLDVLHIGSGFATTIGELASKVSKNFDNCPIIVTNQNINPNFYIPEVIKTSRYLCATETISLDIGLPRWKQSLMKKPIN